MPFASRMVAGREALVLLSLDTRGVGRVTVIRCSGRIVAGNETERLRSHITGMMLEHKEFVLDLSDVAFIDSSGLGTMVRLLTSTRQQRGDLKLCNVPQLIYKTLKTTNLTSLFETHESEESAIAAFYRRKAATPQAATSGVPVLCIDQNGDVLAYLRELLRRGGYDVHTSNSLKDSLILMRVTRPAILLIGPNLTAAPAVQQAFETARASVPVIELGSEFSTSDAGEAAQQLLERIQERLQPNAGLAS
jgi:anti-sigma B factor antagonist